MRCVKPVCVVAVAIACGNSPRSHVVDAVVAVDAVSSGPDAVPEPPQVAHRYSPATVAANPERGTFHGITLPADLASYVSETGNQLARANIDLQVYRTGPLPQGFLDDLATDLAAARAAGVKLIVRFAYDFSATGNDASATQILQHIAQLAPVVTAQADSIAWFEAGFIGAWGEWHTSTSGNVTDATKDAVLDKMLEVFPASRAINVRTPRDLIRRFPTPLAAGQAYGGTAQARLGHHNDCFASSETDTGTYADANGGNQREAWSSYLAQASRYVPINGETCAVYPSLSACAPAMAELARLHWTAIDDAWHPDVLAAWRAEGCWAEIRARLGYRLELVSADFNEVVRPGGVVRLRLLVRNTGWAAPVNARPLWFTLTSQVRSNEAWQVEAPVAATAWQPGVDYTYDVRLHVPSTADGAYTLAAWLPDTSPRLRNDARFAIRFASSQAWAQGRNSLGTVEVAPSAPGVVGADVQTLGVQLGP